VAGKSILASLRSVSVRDNERILVERNFSRTWKRRCPIVVSASGEVWREETNHERRERKGGTGEIGKAYF